MVEMEEDNEGMDSKTRLNQFCQRYCLRPVTRKDILYSTTKFGNKQYQSIVRLNCMESQEYAGELCEAPKDAEKSAAQQALKAFQAVIASLPAGKPVKKKPPPSELDEVNKQIADAENPALTDKVKLNALCMRIAKRPLEKGETIYETQQLGVGKNPSGYQATVRLPCLPEDWAMKLFAGEVCQNKQAAEQSAAGIALKALEEDQALCALAEEKVPKKPSEKEGKKAKGKSWKGWWVSKGGPDLPRELVSEAPVAATVLEWKGSFGWVKLSQPLEHPAASKREGKVYLHRQDLKDGKELLVEGEMVFVSLYTDSMGLGAAETGSGQRGGLT
ncbi:unnamed protein product [Durusdinium trenchii]|uniref:Dicer dsRNA-binding fold domain-containing protein n=1 Tax=Durusdinium trenchii TaxID=1381693 RepID=A0ABP0KI44_9DINO